MTSRPMVLAAGALFALFATTPAFARDAQRAPEPNTLVPAGSTRYVPGAFPDRLVAQPAQDAATGFSVAWRTNSAATEPVLEIVVAGHAPARAVGRRAGG